MKCNKSFCLHNKPKEKTNKIQQHRNLTLHKYEFSIAPEA
jgi:hypothetical protein